MMSYSKDIIPKVSVIIPTFNRGKTIGRAIRSVLNQTFQNFEIIVIDDNSDKLDITLQVIRDFNNTKIKYIRLNNKVYGGEARNIGVENSIGQYIAFLDSDDEWIPEKLEVFLNVIKRYSDGKHLYYSSAIVKTRRKINRTFPAKPIENLSYLKYILENNGAIYTPTIMLKKEFASSILWNKSLQRFQDYAYCIDFQNSGGNFIFINEPLTIVNWDRSERKNKAKSNWKHGYRLWYQYKSEEKIWQKFLGKYVLEELLVTNNFLLFIKVTIKCDLRIYVLNNILRILSYSVLKGLKRFF